MSNGTKRTRSDDRYELSVVPVDQDRWPDLEKLFEARGGPKTCWCMIWRASGPEARKTDGPSRKRALKSRVSSGMPIGLLGYVDDEPVAWCSVAPRSTYRELGGPTLGDEEEDTVWSLVCFFVLRQVRGQGVKKRLIEAAAEYAESQGATVLEAYPVRPDSPSYRFMGFVPVFAEAGFEEVGRVGKRRHVMRRNVR